ncbi:MAG: HAD family hydrolase [Bacilli bacterium]|nr:HAD family hydrolase [Bacilli bacterium]
MLNENIKYIVFDIGGVFLKPTTGHWFITPYINDLLKNKIDMEEFKLSLKNNYELVNEISLQTEEEEYSMFYNYYKKSLEDINYSKMSDELLSKMSKSITYDNNRYTFYSDVKDALETLSKKYRLVILSDNFPSIKRILKDIDIDKYFKPMIISTFYGYRKKDKILFEILKNDIQYKEGTAIFIDDSEKNLDIAKEYKLIPIRMDRNKNSNSKYPIINNLTDIK